MVIKRKDWEEQNSKSYTNELNRVEYYIDDKIKSGSTKIAIDKLNLDYHIKDKIINNIIKIYKEAGWSVKRDSYSDCRESWDNLNFI